MILLPCWAYSWTRCEIRSLYVDSSSIQRSGSMALRPLLSGKHQTNSPADSGTHCLVIRPSKGTIWPRLILVYVEMQERIWCADARQLEVIGRLPLAVSENEDAEDSDFDVYEDPAPPIVCPKVHAQIMLLTPLLV